MKTRVIKVGNLSIGGGNPVRVQSMTNTITSDFSSTISQVEKLRAAGCEIVRISVPDEEGLGSFAKIRDRLPELPLIADIHFSADLACKSIEKGADCVRINPGNLGGIEKFSRVIDAVKQHSKALRIGVNAGSLEKDLLKKYKHPTAVALCESAINWVNFAHKHDFSNFKVSIKSSDPVLNAEANLMFASKCDMPLHIGVTEAGPLIPGLIRSTLGLSELLKKGIGDTIRISLSADPVTEVVAGWELLKSLGLRSGVEIISCPTCSRTCIDVVGIAEKLQYEFGYCEKHLKVAVMGCVVNGPGEAKEADIGIAGGKDSAVIFRKGNIVEKVSARDAYSKITEYIKEDLGQED
ncbi:MAG: flavodoxin-dependent (E)-4-hydroxy-3-methylbut-2-enyl-diphosphate synthase [Oligoflexia bacterium]|nr:flavodoxin-dependent (E)-4-hydroxy-3-methylbut-2-enyl-diphosphate synthase [Oligoflexia bacterium]